MQVAGLKTPMGEEFVLIFYAAVFGVAAGVPVLIIPKIIAPKKPSVAKLATFEAGQVPTGESRVRLMMQYYAYLLMFVVFDVISMFLFAWAVAFAGLGLSSALVIAGFLAIILIAMGYALYLAGKRELW